MISIQTTSIGEIPVLEVVSEELSGQAAPLLVFYHGWTSSKNAYLTEAFELAQRGFRVVLPDAVYHGERASEEGLKGPEFFQAILSNVEKFAEIIDQYQDLIKDDQLFAAGESMGGITTCMLMTRYPEIQAAGVMMGTAQLKRMVNYLLRNYINAHEDLVLLNPDFISLLDQLSGIDDLDLSLNMDKLAGRPMHFWHGDADKVVPFEYTRDFIDQAHEAGHEQLSLRVTPGRDHKVPYIEKLVMAEFMVDQI